MRKLSILALLLVFAGCSGSFSLRGRSKLDFNEVFVDNSTVHVEDVAIAEEELGEGQEAVYAQVDAILALAREACDKKRFVEADTLLREALAVLEAKNGFPTDEKTGTTEYHEQIAQIYTDLFPSDYADKTPESIASMVFQRQLGLSLDSLDLSSADSARLANLNCRQGIPYNLPIAWNERVQKALFVVVERRQSSVERWIQRANYYLPIMKELFADSGLPTDLAYLPLIESGFNPRAYSYAHASGIWQFIPSTGIRYGLRQDYWFDERRDPIKSTKSAISYLKKLYGDFGDWFLALAAYNCGENGVARAIRRDGTDDYWQLRLPRQTMNYVPQFLAALMVAKNPGCFGLEVPEIEPFSLDTVHSSECLDLATISEGLTVPLSTLKEINPHIRRWCTPPDVSNVTVYLPQGKAQEYGPFYATLDDKDKVKWRRYQIRHGDNLGTIARQYGLSVSALKSVNHLNSNRIIAGKYLFIPVQAGESVAERNTDPRPAAQTPRGTFSVPGDNADSKATRTYRVRTGDTVSEIAEKHGVSVQDICRWNGLDQAGRIHAGTVLTLYTLNENAVPEVQAQRAQAGRTNRGLASYTVEKGDNLYTLARRFGTSVKELAALNGRGDSDLLIRPGEVLHYPLGETAPHTAPTPSPVAVATVYKVRTGDNLWDISRRFSVSLGSLLEANGMSRNSVIRVDDMLRIPAPGDGTGQDGADEGRVVYYTVRKGDNLWNIARAHSVSVGNLCTSNQITQERVLMPGDSIRIVLSGDL